MDRIPRPSRFKDFTGQERVKHELEVAVQAARARGHMPEHILLSGPPGLGKTTLAGIVAEEVGSALINVSAPAIARPGDLVSILTSMDAASVVFVDEIHALERASEEILHSAMEDGHIDILVGEGNSSRSIRLPLEEFTLVGATTRAGDISGPMLDRFGIVARLELYSDQDLARIVERGSVRLDVQISEEAAGAIAARSQGTPRIANRWLRRVRDWAQVHGTKDITLETAEKALESFGIDELGLDPLGRDILQTLAAQYGGGPAGLGAIASSVGETESTVANAYEPHLLRAGLLRRTPRGRELTEEGWAHIRGMREDGSG